MVAYQHSEEKRYTYKTINVTADEDGSMSIYLTTIGYFINYTENLNPNRYG